MPSRVRDLDQMQEYDPEAHKLRLRGLVLALLAIVALAFAFDALVNNAADGDEKPRDPLDQLERLAAAHETHGATKTNSGRRDSPQPKAAVQTADLTFEHNLLETEERPEVLAALAAAGREEAYLADGARELPLAPAVPEVERRGKVPAALAAGSLRERFERTRKHDKLVDAALPEPGAPRAAVGHEGEYTLQVISYDSRSVAEAFASDLRARGHEAFVSAGEVEGGGRHYRVRLGPFKTKQSAEEYRKQFETAERMSTIVIKRARERANDA